MATTREAMAIYALGVTIGIAVEAVRPIEDVPVGHALGSQRDPEQRTIALCGLCASALCAGDLATLVARHTDERTVRRDG